MGRKSNGTAKVAEVATVPAEGPTTAPAAPAKVRDYVTLKLKVHATSAVTAETILETVSKIDGISTRNRGGFLLVGFPQGKAGRPAMSAEEKAKAKAEISSFRKLMRTDAAIAAMLAKLGRGEELSPEEKTLALARFTATK